MRHSSGLVGVFQSSGAASGVQGVAVVKARCDKGVNKMASAVVVHIALNMSDTTKVIVHKLQLAFTLARNF